MTNELPTTSGPQPIDQLISPQVHPITGDVSDSARAEENADTVLGREVQSQSEAVEESRPTDTLHQLSPEGQALVAADKHAYVDARREQMQREADSPK